MSIELVKILEEAQRHYKAEMFNWKEAQKADEENDLEGYNLFWAASQYEGGIVKGLLYAYELATGRHVFEWQIKNELYALA